VTGETMTVVLQGEFDVTSEGALSASLERIRQRGPSRLIFDMAAVGYLDCASARLIAGVGRWLPPGVKPVIVSPSPLARRVLQVSGVEALFEIEPDGSCDDDQAPPSSTSQERHDEGRQPR
jgi:anti-anti-sigma factor